jgi:hypothetical protein
VEAHGISQVSGESLLCLCHALRPRRNCSAMPLPQSNVAPADKRTKASASPRFTELNNMASTLTVYASDFDYSASARLVSGDWQGLTGWISTTGLHCQFQDNLLSSIPRLQTWPGAICFRARLYFILAWFILHNLTLHALPVRVMSINTYTQYIHPYKSIYIHIPSKVYIFI